MLLPCWSAVAVETWKRILLVIIADPRWLAKPPGFLVEQARLDSRKWVELAARLKNRVDCVPLALPVPEWTPH
ncbi:MAG: hypothetical protein N2C14_01725, partial [Planctomycetales bacterium]